MLLQSYITGKKIAIKENFWQLNELVIIYRLEEKIQFWSVKFDRVRITDYYWQNKIPSTATNLSELR